MTDPQKDEHIEELLGKLQGIFGKLSHSEEEEAKQKVEVPTPAPKEQSPKENNSGTQNAPPKAPTPLNLYSDPPPADAPSAEAAQAKVPSEPTPAPQTAGAYDSTVPVEDPERMIVPTALYFSPGREAEAKSLAQKLETMTPKFTKVAFRLRVTVFLPYDPKSDWKETIIQKSAEIPFKTVFVVVDRPLEDPKRKAVAASLEERDIYFQEVTLGSIEKKAIYTDILLGLVFFFDSRKPAPKPEET